MMCISGLSTRVFSSLPVLSSIPTKKPQTDDLDFENGAYYNASSEKVEVVSQTTGAQLHPVAGESSAKAMIYNLQGQRVDANYHGVVVCNGRKYVQ